MQQAHDAEVDHIVAQIRERAQQILADQLLGLYLYGSLVTGDFDPAISDIDLLAVTTAPLDQRQFDELDQMHQTIAAKHPRWDGRIEIAYVAADVLRTFRTQVSLIAVMSPGEPFHLKEAGRDWLINWWVVRNQGVTLLGPAPQAAIGPIDRAEFVQAVRDQAREWRDWIYHMTTRPAQAYAIVTLCRALYAFTSGEQASKRQAAHWAQAQMPEWAALIEQALHWRRAWRDEDVDHAATFPETVRFINAVADRIDATA